MANDLSAFIPEVWAAESLMILNQNLVAGNLVYRDFSNEIAAAGDVVNAVRPSKFYGTRKNDGDNVTTQNATATKVPVPLDQYQHVSFVIHDGDESKGLGSLVNTYLAPAVQGVAQAIDEAILGERYNFFTNSVGKLGTTATVSTVVGANTKLNEQLAPMTDRYMIVSPAVAGALQEISTFHEAQKVGDAGTALASGSLGMKFGLNLVMSQNCPTIGATDVVTTAINKTAGYAAGTTTIAVDSVASMAEGMWLTVAGDMTPQLITGCATTTTVTIYPGLKYAVENNATVTTYTGAQVNLTAGYAAAYAKVLNIDTTTLAPKIGQMISTGTTSSTLKLYSSIATVDSSLGTVPSTTRLGLNRPLTTGVSNNDQIGFGPAGEYSFAFHPNAIALVSRPLATPMAGTGALSAVANANGLSVRVTITYDGVAQGHRVTVDVLCGVKTLDTNLGVLVLS